RRWLGYGGTSPGRQCAWCELCWPAFPLDFALRFTGFAGERSALSSASQLLWRRPSFSCPCIIGYDSSSSRCGPPVSAQGTTRHEISQVPDAICLLVMWPLDPGGMTVPHITALLMLRLTVKTGFASASRSLMAHVHTR